MSAKMLRVSQTWAVRDGVLDIVLCSRDLWYYFGGGNLGWSLGLSM